MVHNRTTNFWNLAAQFFLGSSTLASVAFLRLGVDLASTAFVYLIVIVLFALCQQSHHLKRDERGE
jgi:hypothetical protein